MAPTPNTNELLQKLQEKSTAEDRAELAKKIEHLANGAAASAEEEAFLKKMIDAFASDVDQQVRRMLALSVKKSKFLSHEIALKLAHDVSSVSGPILQFSQVLSEADLVGIIKNAKDAEKQKAVAMRVDVTEKVSDALVTHALDASVVNTLLINSSAQISESTLGEITTRYHGNEDIMKSAIRRESLPINVLNQIFSQVTAHIRDGILHDLEKKYGLPHSAIRSLAERTESLTMLSVLDTRAGIADSRMMAESLHDQNHLNANLFLASLFIGKHYFAKYCIAKLADIPYSKIEHMLQQATPGQDFHEALDAALLPASFAMDIFYCITFAAEKDEHHSPVFVQMLYRHIQENPNLFPNARYFLLMLSEHPYLDSAQL